MIAYLSEAGFFNRTIKGSGRGSEGAAGSAEGARAESPSSFAGRFVGRGTMGRFVARGGPVRFVARGGAVGVVGVVDRGGMGGTGSINILNQIGRP